MKLLLRTLLHGNEITKPMIDLMRPKKAKPARAHRLPKIHKEILSIPKFRPTIYITRTSHCFLGKYLESLLYPLTTNELSLKGSFNAASRI